MRAVVIFISLVAVLLIGAVATTIWLVTTAAPPPPPRMAVAPVEVQPATIDLGPISQCKDPISMKAALVNTSDKPMHLTQVVAACGCTVPNLKTPLRLGPGERHEFEVSLDPWSALGTRNQRVDFIYAETQRAPSFVVAYEVAKGIRTTPAAGHRHDDPGLVVRITADDGERFTIESIDPPVTEDWIRTPSSETHISLDWESVDAAARTHPDLFEFDEEGRWRRGIMTIRISRQDCPQVHLRLYNKSTSTGQPSALSTLPPAPSSTHDTTRE